MRTPLTTFAASLVLAAVLVPALAAPPAMALPSLLGPPPYSGSGNNTTVSSITVAILGPSLVIAGTTAYWDVYIGYDVGNSTPPANNTTTPGPTHHVDLIPFMSGATGTLRIDPTSVDVPEGGWVHARLQATLDVVNVPRTASVNVYAYTADDSTIGSASFLVV
jgi:hypothetical protein